MSERERPAAEPVADDPNWLALAIRDGFLLIVVAIERRLNLPRKHVCPRCGWRG